MSTVDSLTDIPPLEPEPPDPRIDSDAPEYSPEPTLGETSLGSSPTIRPDTARRTFFVRQDDITLSFVRQLEDAVMPRYGRAGRISGQVHLASTYGVTAVSLQLEGRLIVDIEERLPMYTYSFLKIPLSLWEKGTTGEKAPPFAMPFRIDFPETFTDGDNKEYPLPPSYEPDLESASLKDMYAQCSYSVSVRMTRSRFMPSKAMVQKVNYEPRTVPPPHTLVYPFPYLSVTDGAAPHGWRRYDETVVARPQTGFQDVHCQFYTPALRVYSMKSGPIPYFLRVHGHSDSMSALLCHAPSAPSSPLRSRWGRSHAMLPAATYDIDVNVKRQVSIAVGGIATSRSYIIGKGTLRDVPPVYQTDRAECTVDYEGELQLEPTLAVGGFDVGKLSIADFFILSIKAADPRKAAFDDLTHSHTVRIVTGI